MPPSLLSMTRISVVDRSRSNGLGRPISLTMTIVLEPAPKRTFAASTAMRWVTLPAIVRRNKDVAKKSVRVVVAARRRGAVVAPAIALIAVIEMVVVVVITLVINVINAMSINVINAMSIKIVVVVAEVVIDPAPAPVTVTLETEGTIGAMIAVTRIGTRTVIDGLTIVVTVAEAAAASAAVIVDPPDLALSLETASLVLAHPVATIVVVVTAAATTSAVVVTSLMAASAKGADVIAETVSVCAAALTVRTIVVRRRKKVRLTMMVLMVPLVELALVMVMIVAWAVTTTGPSVVTPLTATMMPCMRKNLAQPMATIQRGKRLTTRVPRIESQQPIESSKEKETRLWH